MLLLLLRHRMLVHHQGAVCSRTLLIEFRFLTGLATVSNETAFPSPALPDNLREL
jgi:hypothetical protein